MNAKTAVDKIFEKIWSDFHITPEEFEMSRKESHEEYEKHCANLSDQDKQRIEKACELFSSMMESGDPDEIRTIAVEYEAELKTLNFTQHVAVNYFRAEYLVKKFKDTDCYTSRKIREQYRDLARRLRSRR